jgi:hypothetical protein
VSNQLVGTPFFCQVATKISAACFLWLDSIHPSNSSLHSLDMTTDYGRSLKPFFFKISFFGAWADNLGICKFFIMSTEIDKKNSE